MSAPTPYFSVVTPSYNQGNWIEGCIESVLSQGVDDFEHIVFDNCSTDETAAIAARHSHLQFHSERDRGQSHALNKALELARGEIVCWLNADDQYAPGAFDVVRREFTRPEVDVIFGDAREVFFDGRPSEVRRARFGDRDDFLYWWEKRTDLLQPAVFFRRKLLARTGPLEEDFYIMMDTELWWRMTAIAHFHYIPEVLAIQQRQPESKTVMNVALLFEEKQRFFDPLLKERFPASWPKNVLARHYTMGMRFARLAEAAGDRRMAQTMLRLSVRQNPAMLLSPTWWKARVKAGKQRNPTPPLAALQP